MNEQVAIVTGGGSGIGRATCLRFAEAGAHVVAAARTQAQLGQTKAKVESRGGKCTIIPTDVSSPDEVAHLIEATVAKLGRIDVLVNCAGVGPRAPIEEFEISVFTSVLGVNVAAVFYSSKGVWPVMKKQGGGTIVNISSMAAKDPFPGFTVYGASKAWVNAFTHGLAEEGRKHNIRVFCIAPGTVETQMLRGAFPDFPAEKTLQPADVAEMVFAVTHPHCAYATGATIYIRK
ncbi:MAG: SDR family oxidoreductase [Planctomycetota bacterium]